MGDFLISSFKFGLDTRKDVLTSQPGTLLTCENASINPGGEIEKRKKFGDEAANTDVLDSNGAVGTYGLEVTDAGLVVFGSALNFGASVTQSQPTLASALVGVTYQQLKHPTLTNDSGENYDASKHKMTSALISENFNGKAFVIATFADTRKFLYYDGTLVQQSVNGLVLDGRIALADLSTDLVRQLVAIGWTGTANTDELDVAQNGSTIVKSPQSNFFTPVPSETASSGYVGTKDISLSGAATAGTQAIASFKVDTNSGTFKLEAPSQATATTPVIDLCGAPVAALGSATLTASAIARAVNDLTSVHGYSALTNTDDVFVYAPVGYDVSLAIELTVTVTTGTTAASSSTPSGVTAILSPTVIDVVITVPPANLVSRDFQVICTPSGGTAPYTFAWGEATPGSGHPHEEGGRGPGILLLNAASAAVTFRCTAAPDETPVAGSYKCEVRDASGSPVDFTAFITVRFAAEVI